MPKTFDGTDFDIHALNKPIEPKLVTLKERVSKKMKKDMGNALAEREKPKKKSLIIALSANIVLAGLGSVYVKRTFAGVNLTSFNLFFLILGLSPFSLLTGLPLSLLLSSTFSILYLLSFLFAIAAWCHLFYQLWDNRSEFELMA